MLFYLFFLSYLPGLPRSEKSDNLIETSTRMFSSPVCVRGYAPLPRFFCLQGLICLFYSKKLVYLLQYGIF
ncbi:hypothetical protein BREVNS_0194 [Brevinematales bacterium NS]|nr:hypothetical protein BREVNS_0194 [Brevinematales bacterium NS]